MGLNTDLSHPLRQRSTNHRHADIGYIVARLTQRLADARAPLATDDVRLHNVCRTAISTVIRMTSRSPVPVPFDVNNGLGELSEALFGVIRNEYRLILDPEPVPGLLDTLTLATSGLMMRAVADVLVIDLDREVDLQLSALMRRAA